MSNQIKHFSLGLASAIALGLLACGSPSGTGKQVGPDPGPIVTPPTDPLPEPQVQYNFFRPKTEDELRGAVCRVRVGGEGDDLGDSEPHYRYLPAANYGYLIARTKADFDPAAFDMHGLEVVSSFCANGAKYYYLHKDSDLVATMKKVGKLSGVMYIESDTMNYATGGFEYKPGDSYVNSEQQYGVLTTMAKKAWETYGFGPNRPIVANFDTGVRWSHQDLKDVVKHAFSWYGTASGAGLLTNIGALSPLADPNPPDRIVTDPALSSTDGNGHGTHTIGSSVAMGNNGVGVAGMCWNADMVSYKTMSDAGSGGSWPVYGSFWHLVKWKNEMVGEEGNKKPRYPHTIPVNLSLSGGVLGQFNADMVEMALEHGIVPIAASGNDAAGFPAWPSGLAGTITVGAVGQSDRRVIFSNWGPHLSVMAPGSQILSVSRGSDNGYAWMSGTSMACPHVTGLVAYMLTFNPDLKADQIKTYLEQNADPIDGQTGFDIHFGYGRINAYRTIGAVIDDMNADRAPASNYVLSPVKVTVKNDAGDPISDALVYLYNCDNDGTISNYANMTISGTSFVDVMDNATIPPEDGVARFNLLRPGFYKAAVNYTCYDSVEDEDVTLAAETSVFEVRAGAAVAPLTVTLATGKLLAMQTLATANTARGGTAAFMQLYNSQGSVIADIGGYTFNTGVAKMLPPGTYYLLVYPYNANFFGEYALWVGTKTRSGFSATGTYAVPGADGVKSQHAGSIGSAQEIELNGKLVYGDLTDTTGHFYKFVIPEPAP